MTCVAKLIYTNFVFLGGTNVKFGRTDSKFIVGY
jgi:hypothetical protein